MMARWAAAVACWAAALFLGCGGSGAGVDDDADRDGPDASVGDGIGTDDGDIAANETDDETAMDAVGDLADMAECDGDGVPLGIAPGGATLDLPDPPWITSACPAAAVSFRLFAVYGSGSIEVTSEATWTVVDPDLLNADPDVPGRFLRRDQAGTTQVIASYGCSEPAVATVSVMVCHGP